MGKRKKYDDYSDHNKEWETARLTAGEKLRALRRRSGITLVELAKKSGVPGRRLSQFERGRDKVLKMDEIKRVAEALGYKPIVFFL